MRPMRLTPELIVEGEQSLNPCQDRTLVLRGNKIAVIENLELTKDQYACIDLCDNDVMKINVIPKLGGLKTILLANNNISRIDSHAFVNLTGLTSLSLSHNRISNLATLLPISSLVKLERLSLRENPVTKHPHFRMFVIHLMGYCHNFRYLDHQRITVAERANAKEFFQTEEGRKLLSNIVPEAGLAEEKPHAATGRKYALSQEVLSKIKIALTEAEDMAVVNELERTVKTGEISDEVAKIIGID
jgi:hypothetical protein